MKVWKTVDFAATIALLVLAQRLFHLGGGWMLLIALSAGALHGLVWRSRARRDGRP